MGMKKKNRIDSVKPVTARELTSIIIFMCSVLLMFCVAGVVLWPSINDSFFTKRDYERFIDWPAVYERNRDEQDQLDRDTLSARVNIRVTQAEQARRRNEQTMTMILKKR